MVDVSHETPEQTNVRLEQVIKKSKLKIYTEAYAFEEFPITEFSVRVRPDALALVRDDAVWSQLIQDNSATEPFAIWRFHFPLGADNSGFVGWLATRLKQRFGTGVFVVCGQNSQDGGIFDYWGCPWHLRKEVQDEILNLVS
jgi:Family of unknown function (DUF6196)